MLEPPLVDVAVEGPPPNMLVVGALDVEKRLDPVELEAGGGPAGVVDPVKEKLLVLDGAGVVEPMAGVPVEAELGFRPELNTLLVGVLRLLNSPPLCAPDEGTPIPPPKLGVADVDPPCPNKLPAGLAGVDPEVVPIPPLPNNPLPLAGVAADAPLTPPLNSPPGVDVAPALKIEGVDVPEVAGFAPNILLVLPVLGAPKDGVAVPEAEPEPVPPDPKSPPVCEVPVLAPKLPKEGVVVDPKRPPVDGAVVCPNNPPAGAELAGVPEPLPAGALKLKDMMIKFQRRLDL